MYVRIKFGFLIDNLNKAIPISRKKMEYASHMEKNGWFAQPTYTPIEEDHVYWLHYMSKVHPWNDLSGIYNTALMVDKEDYVFVKCEVIAKIAILLRG